MISKFTTIKESVAALSFALIFTPIIKFKYKKRSVAALLFPFLMRTITYLKYNCTLSVK